MWIDDHPCIFFYLVGSVLVVVLSLFKVVLFWAIDWVIRANVFTINLRKLLPPDETTFGEKAAKCLGILTIEALLSWINVAVVLWQIFSTLLRVSRDLLQPAPEAIKVLRFPLRNNPDMPRESVWAHVHALGVRGGEALPTKEALVSSLSQVVGYYPTFDRVAALKQLESLNILSSEVISASLTAIKE